VAFLFCLSCSAFPSLPFPFILSFPAVPFFLFCSAFLFWLYHHERNGDCKSKSANMKELGSANFTVKKTAGGSAQASGTQTRREKSARPAIVRVSLRIFCLLKWDKPMLFHAFVRCRSKNSLISWLCLFLPIFADFNGH
jgi:hypothetical protein